MALDQIALTDFRNHAASRLDGTAKFNLLVGENGAGKTNVLEALSLFAPGRGLRRAGLPDMARTGGGGGFAVSAQLQLADGSDAVRLGTGTAPERPGRRLVHINSAEASALALGEWLSIGWLTPAMDRLFADSAGARRRYMDRLAVALDPAHARHAARYENALRERNRMLADTAEQRKAPDALWFSSVESQLAEAGAALASGRARLISALEASLQDLPSSPFAKPSLHYSAGGPLDADALADSLAATRSRDVAAQRTLTGPHRDELEVRLAEKDMPASLCSTGEQKALLIALTLTHAGLTAAGRPSLLLLDEVAAHLDPIRRAALFERLQDGHAQVWLTATEAEPFAQLAPQCAVWRIAANGPERIA